MNSSIDAVECSRQSDGLEDEAERLHLDAGVGCSASATDRRVIAGDDHDRAEIAIGEVDQIAQDIVVDARRHRRTTMTGSWPSWDVSGRGARTAT